MEEVSVIIMSSTEDENELLDPRGLCRVREDVEASEAEGPRCSDVGGQLAAAVQAERTQSAPCWVSFHNERAAS